MGALVELGGEEEGMVVGELVELSEHVISVLDSLKKSRWVVSWELWTVTELMQNSIVKQQASKVDSLIQGRGFW